MSRDDNSVDLASVFGRLNITLGDVSKKISAGNDLQKAAARVNMPVFAPVTQNDNANVNGVVILRFGGPDQGHFWYIREIKASGLSIATAIAAGKCDIFVSASDLRSIKNVAPGAELAAVGVADWRWRLGGAPSPNTGLPDARTLGRGEMTLRLNEELFMIFTGLTAGTAVVGSILFEDFEEGAVKQLFAE